MPVKKTNVMPNDMPHIFNLPRYTPIAEIKLSTMTACVSDGSRNTFANHSIYG